MKPGLKWARMLVDDLRTWDRDEWLGIARQFAHHSQHMRFYICFGRVLYTSTFRTSEMGGERNDDRFVVVCMRFPSKQVYVDVRSARSTGFSPLRRLVVWVVPRLVVL